MSDKTPIINSEFWEELPHEDDPYCTKIAICSGYDVYGDLLGKASYFEYLYLLFKKEPPNKKQSHALELIAVALANPGPRDPSVHAAMCAGVGECPSSAILYAALACGAGSYGGAREVYLMAEFWQTYGTKLNDWCELLMHPKEPTREEVWPVCEHPPGFAPYDTTCRLPVLQTLDHLITVLPNGLTSWLFENRLLLEEAAGHPLAMTGLAATVLTDIGFSPQECEVFVLMFRLPGAAAHALEQQRLGFRQFPYFSLSLSNDPGPLGKNHE